MFIYCKYSINLLVLIKTLSIVGAFEKCISTIKTHLICSSIFFSKQCEVKFLCNLTVASCSTL